MQIVQIKQIENKTADSTTRFKLHLYDGDIQHTFGILGTQLNYLIENGDLKVNSVVKITKYASNVLSRDPPKLVRFKNKIDFNLDNLLNLNIF